MFKKIILTILIVIFSVFALTFASKSAKGNLTFYQTEHDTRVGGPFEASNSTSRYALTESIVKDKSFLLSDKLAKFSSPDVVDYKGKFLSIFTPGVSFIGVPFYLLGQKFDMPQLFTYFSVILFAVINIFLIAIIVKKLSGSYLAGLLAGFVFAFATNAFPYALTFSQHIESVTIILLAFITVFGKRTILKNMAFGFLFGVGVLIDIPNAFLLLPIGIYILSEHFSKEKVGERIKINFKISIFTILITLIPFVMLFGWYNDKTTGSYTKLGQSIGRSQLFRENLPAHLTADVIPQNIKEKNDSGSKLPFNTRKELNGFYILLISNERSWIYYSPIILFGIFGLAILYMNKNKRKIASVGIAIVLMNIVLYSMFGDPWGGWAFGPRYLIPAAAILSIGIGELVVRFKRNIIFLILFLAVFGYSVLINSVGAMTTSVIPPKIEAVNLPDPIPYTYEYNFKLLKTDNSSSLLYNTFLYKSIDAQTYTYSFAGIIILVGVLIYLFNLLEKSDNETKTRYFKFPNILKSNNKGDSNV